MHPLAEKVSELARTTNLFPGTSKIVVAVSGGIDSMVLLDVLTQPGLSLRDRLAVVHFNHQLREKESDADAEFVEKVASAYGLPFELGSGDTVRLPISRVRGWKRQPAICATRFLPA